MINNGKEKLIIITRAFTNGEMRRYKSVLLDELDNKFVELSQACLETIETLTEMINAARVARLLKAEDIKTHAIIRARLHRVVWTKLRLYKRDLPLYETLQKLKCHSEEVAKSQSYPDSWIIRANISAAYKLCEFAVALYGESMTHAESYVNEQGLKLINQEFSEIFEKIANYDESKSDLAKRNLKRDNKHFGPPDTIAFQCTVKLENAKTTVNITGQESETVEKLVNSITRLDKKFRNKEKQS